MENEVKMDHSYPNRMGGWLIIIGGIFIVFPLILCLVYIPLFYKIINDPLWELLTTKGTVSFNPYIKPLLIVEMSYMATMAAGTVFALFLYFKKKRFFQKICIVIVSMFTLYPVINFTLSKIFPIKPVDFRVKEFVISVILCIALILYMIFSPRVKNTFVYKLGSKTFVEKRIKGE